MPDNLSGYYYLCSALSIGKYYFIYINKDILSSRRTWHYYCLTFKTCRVSLMIPRTRIFRRAYMRTYPLETYISKSILFVVLATFCVPLLLFADETTPYPVAGVTPYQRPENAPLITQVSKSNDWYENALHGVDAPYPASLRFLENQGNWYTPFTRKGMTGRYDLRKWHTK